jgi:hypothetical protein
MSKDINKKLLETYPIKKKTSIGKSPLSRPTNKSKRRAWKKYRGQGK